jgi:hypothetical protein
MSYSVCTQNHYLDLSGVPDCSYLIGLTAPSGTVVAYTRWRPNGGERRSPESR